MYIRLLSVSLPHLQAYITAAFNTGMRAGEIRNLKWSDIDKGKGFIRLGADSTKEAKPKVISINHHVRRILDSLPQAIHHDYVFTYKGEPLKQPDGLKRSFSTACKKAGIPYGRKTHDGIIFHDIRRMVKTNMLKAGLDKVFRDTILGHSLQGMDAHYLAPSEDDLKQAMDRYTEWLDGQVKVEKRIYYE